MTLLAYRYAMDPTPRQERDADGEPSLWRQRIAGAPEVVYRPPSHGSKGEALLWALIESHVPTVIEEGA